MIRVSVLKHFVSFSLSLTRDIFFSPRNWYSNRTVRISMALTNTIQLFFLNLRCCPVAQNKTCVFVCTRSNHVILIPEYKAAIVALYSFQNYLNFLTQIEFVFNGQFTKYNDIYIYEYTTRSTCWFSSQWYFLNAPEKQGIFCLCLLSLTKTKVNLKKNILITHKILKMFH